MGNSDYESGLIWTTPWLFQVSYIWKSYFAWMQLLTNGIGIFFLGKPAQKRLVLQNKDSMGNSDYESGLIWTIPWLLQISYIWKSYFAYMQLLTNKIKIFPRQVRSKTLGVLECTFHGELWLWVWFDFNNSLTFSNKLWLKKANRLYETFNQRNCKIFPGKLHWNDFFFKI